MIDNYNLISELLDFSDLEKFYFLQIIKRKKEHPELGSNSYVIKSYYINSLEYLSNKYEEVKNLCNFHDARAYINLNRRGYKKCAFQLLRKVTDQLMCEEYRNVRKAYDSICGMYSDETSNTWVIDVDRHDVAQVHERWLTEKLENVDPIGNKVIATIPTKNGYHLITKPFNVSQTKEWLIDDIHKNNPTVLYIK